jgi:hypothetical protein
MVSFLVAGLQIPKELGSEHLRGQTQQKLVGSDLAYRKIFW